MSDTGNITRLLRQIDSGDGEALEELMPMVYNELRAIAGNQLRFERKGHTLNPTALVNEAYLKLVNQKKIQAAHRTQFLMIAGHIMRRILVDYARKRKRQKRGGDMQKVDMEAVEPFLSNEEAEEVLSLDSALSDLEKVDPRASKVIECRFYAGLSLDETASLLEVSIKTVQRDWLAARAWLRKEVSIDLAP